MNSLICEIDEDHLCMWFTHEVDKQNPKVKIMEDTLYVSDILASSDTLMERYFGWWLEDMVRRGALRKEGRTYYCSFEDHLFASGLF